ncbi:MAG: hypothetical protein ACTHKC_09260 [Candidatus Nitrosocosmicus sp.]
MGIRNFIEQGMGIEYYENLKDQQNEEIKDTSTRIYLMTTPFLLVSNEKQSNNYYFLFVFLVA